MNCKIAIIMPALNEEKSIEYLIDEIPKNLISQIVVVDNGSTDETAIIAEKKGAIVVEETKRGYGNACLKGIEYLEENPPSIVVFLDADYSDNPQYLHALINPIAEKKADLVLGSRIKKGESRGELSFHVYAANIFFSKLINFFYGLNLTDLGPFRAISWKTLKSLDMSSKTYGWSAEMIVKAAKFGIKISEVNVGFRKRIGKSKISGSIKSSLIAVLHIFYNIFKFRL
ncbi:MAG: glycosyltransferase family 2 protein [Candidatus Bathyarchaeota archaeon]|nr:glycosyltransferase family 2 protein [Candidatus Bathyarchaeota archaeon]MCZ2845399.1 glycosyltransferase family 2 protein [Candidatus Bathyarchaeota archaeon]